MKAVIKLYVKPGASRNEICGAHGEAIKVRIAAPPIKGRANAELVAYIAKKLGVQKRKVVIKSGMVSKVKTVIIMGMDTEDAVAKLLEK